jgi:capsular exopolysaccharide synthesis family protein
MPENLVKASVSTGPVPRLAYDTRPFEQPDDSAFDVRQIMAVLRRNAWLMILLSLVSTAGVYYAILQEQHQYRAEALIRLRDEQAEVTGGLMPRSEAPTPGRAKADLLSEMIVLKGRQVAGAVVDREGFRLYDVDLDAPALTASDVHMNVPTQEWRQIELRFGTSEVNATSGGHRVSAPYGRPIDLDGVSFTVLARPSVREQALAVLPREDAVDWLLSVLTAKPTEGTDAVTVTAVTPSPLLSTQVVNAVVEEYQSTNAARGRELHRRRRDFLEARIRETNDSLVTAQTALGRFRSRTGVFGAREQFQAEHSDATDAERQGKRLLAEQRIRRGLVAELNQSTAPTQSAAFRTLLASSDIAGNPIVAQLYGRVTELERKRDELLASGRPLAHPEVRQIQDMLTSTEARLVDAIRSQVNSLETRVAALGDVRQQAEAEVSRLTPNEAEEIRLNEQVEAMRGIGSQLRTELQRTRLAQAAELGRVEIVDRATRALPLPSKKPTKLSLGLAFGLLLGLAIAFFRDHLNTGLHRRAEMEQSLNVPGLVVIPQLPRVTRWRRLLDGRPSGGNTHRGRAERARQTSPSAPVILSDLVTIADATNAAAGAYRALRTRLLFANTGATLRNLVITSSWAGEGKTTTAANLAVTLAQQGMRVLLVDCDLRKARLHTLFGLSNDRGLTDVLLERTSLVQAMQSTGVERLFLLSGGTVVAGPVGPSELLGSKRMTALLATAKEQFDMLVLDTQPVLVASDASILAARADGVLLVVRAGTTGRSIAIDAVHQLEAVGAHVVGAVLNDPDAKTARYQEYGQQYRHQNSY